MSPEGMTFISKAQITKFKINSWAWGVVLGVIVGIVLGYAWRMVQIEPRDDKIQRLQIERQYFSDMLKEIPKKGKK